MTIHSVLQVKNSIFVSLLSKIDKNDNNKYTQFYNILNIWDLMIF